MSGHFVSEIALAMPCCDGPAGRFVHRGQVPGGFGQPLDIPGLEAIRLEDEVLGGALDLTTSVPARLIARPHFTVSQSEAGFEKIMQALILRLEWPLDGAARRIGVSLTVTPA